MDVPSIDEHSQSLFLALRTALSFSVNHCPLPKAASLTGRESSTDLLLEALRVGLPGCGFHGCVDSVLFFLFKYFCSPFLTLLSWSLVGKCTAHSTWTLGIT